jgi:hypothetical protein
METQAFGTLNSKDIVLYNAFDTACQSPLLQRQNDNTQQHHTTQRTDGIKNKQARQEHKRKQRNSPGSPLQTARQFLVARGYVPLTFAC